MSKIITVTNQKGGVGKTTTCNALISGLFKMGYKVLGIDLDPQGNLGFSLGLDIEEGLTIYDVFKGTANVDQAIRRTISGDVISSNILLSTAELEFNKPGREFLLKDAISGIRDRYDYIVIDTPPALNILTVNAYVASNYLLIPMIPEILSLLGVSQLKETIDSVTKFYNPALHIMGILLNKYNKRVNLTREVEEMATSIAQQLGTIVIDVKIRNSISVAEAPAHGEGIFTYAPRSNAASDFHALLLKICKGRL